MRCLQAGIFWCWRGDFSAEVIHVSLTEFLSFCCEEGDTFCLFAPALLQVIFFECDSHEALATFEDAIKALERHTEVHDVFTCVQLPQTALVYRSTESNMTG